jgi:hypothetical protein
MMLEFGAFVPPLITVLAGFGTLGAFLVLSNSKVTASVKRGWWLGLAIFGSLFAVTALSLLGVVHGPWATRYFFLIAIGAFACRSITAARARDWPNVLVCVASLLLTLGLVASALHWSEAKTVFSSLGSAAVAVLLILVACDRDARNRIAPRG